MTSIGGDGPDAAGGPPQRAAAHDGRRRTLFALASLGVVLVVALSALVAFTNGPPSAAEGEPTASEQTDRPSAAPTIAPSTPQPAPAEATTPARGFAAGLEVHFINVGQGDATLLRTSEATVLVDTGRHDRDDVVAYLRAADVDHLDVVVVTHPHADHLGQFDRVLETTTVDEVWWSGATHTTQTFERAVDALDASDAAYAEPRAGDTTSVGDLDFEFVNPPPDVDLADLHDSGLAFRVTYDAVRVLFTGDAEAETEQRMVAHHRDLLAADVYQVGHHGSATSTSPAFLAAVAPRLAVYSAGAGNPYGHPHDEVVERFRAGDLALLGTDEHGTIVVTSDGRTFDVDAERGQPAPGGEGRQR